MSIKNARTLGIRLDADDAATLKEIEDTAFIDGVALARASLKAALTHWRQHKSLSLPLQITDAAASKQPAPKPVKTGAIYQFEAPETKVAEIAFIAERPA